MATLSLSHVSKHYPNGFTAVHDISAQIDDGEFVVMVGPSGCGKSTLLRMVAGLEEISDGDIRIGNQVVNRLEPAQRNIAMVFQNYALYPHMNVFDNMAYGLKIAKVPKEEIAKRVEAAAAMLELAPLLERKPRQLSGGQRQRVAMGRAIVREPQVFLFDEPLSNLDAKLRVQMRFEIQKLHERLKTTSLYVTHDQIEAMTLADRIIMLNQGKAEQIGTPEEVYHRPASTFVAQFMGMPPMNLIKVTAGPRGTLNDEHGNPIILSLHVPPALEGQTVWLGLRAEHLHPGSRGIPVTVELVEELGSEELLHGQVFGQRIAAKLQHQHRDRLPRMGETVYLDYNPRHQPHWFDLHNGLRLNPD